MEQDENESIGALKALVRCAGNQRNLALVIGVSETHISRMLRGHYPVPKYLIVMSEMAQAMRNGDLPERWKR